MKIIVIGDESFRNYDGFGRALTVSGLAKSMTEIVCMGTPGVARLAEQYARRNRLPLKLFTVRPDDMQWKGKQGIRELEQEMFMYGDVVLAVGDGTSPNTKRLIAAARATRLRVVDVVVASSF